MSEWIEFKALAKLLWVIVQVRLGRKPENTQLCLTPAEADVITKLAAEQGWRAVICKMQEAQNAHNAT
jgi:hypothetical protein